MVYIKKLDNSTGKISIKIRNDSNSTGYKRSNVFNYDLKEIIDWIPDHYTDGVEIEVFIYNRNTGKINCIEYDPFETSIFLFFELMDEQRIIAISVRDSDFSDPDDEELFLRENDLIEEAEFTKYKPADCEPLRRTWSL